MLTSRASAQCGKHLNLLIHNKLIEAQKIVFCQKKRFASSLWNPSEGIFESIQKGDEKSLQMMLNCSDQKVVNLRDKRGWTPLMYAAKAGNIDMVDMLLYAQCDTRIKNKAGHTSEDLALFWKHKHIADMIANCTTSSLPHGHHGNNPHQEQFFCDTFLHAADHRRKDHEWIQGAINKEDTKIILFHNLRPLCRLIKVRKFNLQTFSSKQLQFEVNPLVGHVFLGVEGGENSNITDQEGEPPAWFAADLSHLPEDDVLNTGNEGDLVLLEARPGLLMLNMKDAAISGKARTLLDWHNRYRFCATCGSKTHAAEAGHRRLCSNSQCLTQKGIHNTCYPRVDPSVISLVVHPSGEKCLLGRQPRFPQGMWSCLAGFIEPGENIEAACRREVYEESGIHIDKVQYLFSQPWPMPASLMLGCIAYATSQNIQIDKNELDDASWFTRKDLVSMVTQSHSDGFFVPPQQAIAHHLIKHWLRETA